MQKRNILAASQVSLGLAVVLLAAVFPLAIPGATARTMTLDTKTHNVLLVTARHGHGSTYQNVLPDTFVVLVVGK